MKKIIIILLAVLPITAYAADCDLYQHSVDISIQGGASGGQSTTYSSNTPILDETESSSSGLGIDVENCIHSNDKIDLFFAWGVAGGSDRSTSNVYLGSSSSLSTSSSFQIGFRTIIR